MYEERGHECYARDPLMQTRKNFDRWIIIYGLIAVIFLCIVYAYGVICRL